MIFMFKSAKCIDLYRVYYFTYFCVHNGNKNRIEWNRIEKHSFAHTTVHFVNTKYKNNGIASNNVLRQDEYERDSSLK